jgi:phenylalanyl-tRNA synthetase beta chain
MMKFSEKWLHERLGKKVQTDELVHRLTMAGLEVDAVECPWDGISGLVIGEVLSVEGHPNADRLKLCQVTDGEQSYQVVCGAPNVREGLRVVFAMPGARLPGGFKIRKSKIRGVESLGMICSEEELALAEKSEGIMELPADVIVGASAIEWLNLDDRMIEVDLTPNRGDCLSIEGLAREAAALFEYQRPVQAVEAVPPLHQDQLAVSLQAPEGCPRYLGRIIRGVNASNETPGWMKERLRRSGIRSISALVDVTNYVLLELGQPMHAFDLDSLTGEIQVRMAGPDERLELLDESGIALRPDMLVIADSKKPLALAGVMGGAESEVRAGTRNIFLESAFFAPVALAGIARSVGLHTDASHRFERGVDPALCATAMERATALVLDICGGEAGPVTCAEVPEHLPVAAWVPISGSRISRLLGLEFDAQAIEGLLSRLGCRVKPTGPGQWEVQPPSWRFDLAIEEDFAEELARIYGYDRLPVAAPSAPLSAVSSSESTLDLYRIKDSLASRDYREAITWSFTDPAVQKLLSPSGPGVQLSNPISSELSEMRTSLWPGLLLACQHNLNRQAGRVRLFETGLRFLGKDMSLEQRPTLAMLITGPRYPEGWLSSGQLDFYDLKADVESLYALAGIQPAFESLTDVPCLHPGQSARIIVNGHSAGMMGALHPVVAGKYVDRPTYVAELDLSSILGASVPVYSPVSRYPGVERDFAVVLRRDLPAAAILEEVRRAGGDLLKDAWVFDVYTGEGMPADMKSVAIKLWLQAQNETLKADVVSACFDKVIRHVEARFEARLRA